MLKASAHVLTPGPIRDWRVTAQLKMSSGVGGFVGGAGVNCRSFMFLLLRLDDGHRQQRPALACDFRSDVLLDRTGASSPRPVRPMSSRTWCGSTWSPLSH